LGFVLSVFLLAAPIESRGLNNQLCAFVRCTIHLTDLNKVETDFVERLIDCVDVQHDRGHLSWGQAKYHEEQTDKEDDEYVRAVAEQLLREEEDREEVRLGSAVFEDLVICCLKLFNVMRFLREAFDCLDI